MIQRNNDLQNKLNAAELANKPLLDEIEKLKQEVNYLSSEIAKDEKYIKELEQRLKALSYVPKEPEKSPVFVESKPKYLDYIPIKVIPSFYYILYRETILTRY